MNRLRCLLSQDDNQNCFNSWEWHPNTHTHTHHIRSYLSWSIRVRLLENVNWFLICFIRLREKSIALVFPLSVRSLFDCHWIDHFEGIPVIMQVLTKLMTILYSVWHATAIQRWIEMGQIEVTSFTNPFTCQSNLIGKTIVHIQLWTFYQHWTSFVRAETKWCLPKNMKRKTTTAATGTCVSY